MSVRAPQIWIVHRDAAELRALEHLIGARDAAQSGSPTDPAFETATPPRAVVLGITGDVEIELEFVHRNAARLDACSWILVASNPANAALLELFDTLDARVLIAPCSAAQLRATIRESLAAGGVRDSLSLRRSRDVLAERFARWFDDIGVDALLRAMDPKIANVPLVVRGEPGTGRSLFARYVHTFGGHAAGGSMPFVEIDCAHTRVDSDLLDAIAQATGAASATLMLQGAEALPAPLRTRVVEWIEYGLPPGIASGTRLRWVASLPAGDTGTTQQGDAALLAALAGLSFSIPPVRERRAAIAAFARATSHSWSRAAGRRDREFEPSAIEALELHNWPGNLRELETVVVRALSEYSENPLSAQHLRIEPSNGLDWPGELAEDATARVLPSATAEPAEAAATEADVPLIVLTADDLVQDEAVPLDPPDDVEEYVGEYEALSKLVPDDRGWQSLLGSVSGELREALGRIRTLAELIPDHYADPEFRARFAELMGADIRGVGGILERLDTLGRTDGRQLEPVDSTDLIESVLAELRSEVLRHNLVVLKELDRQRPLAVANPVDLHLALSGLLENLIVRSDDDGDLYIASHHNASGLREKPSLRILVRHIPGRDEVAAVSPQLRLELTLCEKVAETAGGAFTVSEGSGGELVVVLDLPAPL